MLLPGTRYLVLVLWLAVLLLLLPANILPAVAVNYGTVQDEAKQLLSEANQLIASNQPDQAIPLLQRAVDLAPQSPAVHHSLGVAYQNTRHSEQAIAEYKRVLQLQPQLLTVPLNIAHCYANMQNYDECNAWYEKYLQTNPQAADFKQVEAERQDNLFRKSINIGIKEFKDGKNIDARRSFQQAILLKPDSADAHFKLAAAMNLCGEVEHAISEFSISRNLNPKLSDATYNIAVSYQNLGDVNKAIYWFQQYMKETPDSSNSQIILNKIEALRQAGSEFNADPHLSDYYDNTSSNGRHYRWPATMLPIRIYLDPGTTVEGFRQSYTKDFLDSLEAWAKASEYRLGFMLVPDKSQAFVICDWTNDPTKVSDEGKAVEQGWSKVHGKGDPRGNVWIHDATIRILIKSRKGVLELTDDDIKKACLHEIGHMLGINGHSTNNHDVMFFSESPSVWPALSKRDKATIQHLYEAYPPLSPPIAN